MDPMSSEIHGTRQKSAFVSENLSDSVIVFDSKDNADAEGQNSNSKSTVEEHKEECSDDDDGKCNRKSSDLGQESHVVIDMKNVNNEEEEEEKMKRECRICQLSDDQTPEIMDSITGKPVNMNLIQIGCRCKDDLGLAHVYCAESWFKLKGNRMCEICGETARNITGICEEGVIEEWRDDIMMDESGNRRRICVGRPSCCNILMALLVTIFVLSWFFRVNMF